MNKARLLIVILLGLFICACAKPQVKVLMEGEELPHSSYNSRNPKTDMRVQATVAWYEKKRDSKYDDYYFTPHYLDVGNTYTDLPRKAEFVQGTIKVVNNQNAPYTAKVITKFQDGKSDWPIVQSEVIYTGKSHKEVFQVKSHVQKQNPLVSMIFLIEEGITKPKKTDMRKIGINHEVTVFHIPLVTYQIAGKGSPTK